MLGVVVVLAVLLAPIGLLLLAGGDSADDAQRRVTSNPLAVVRAAVGGTVATGGFEMDTVTTTRQPGRPAPSQCRLSPSVVEPRSDGRGYVVRDGGPCPPFPPQVYEFGTHVIVNFAPYAMVARTSTGSFAGVTTHVNSTHVWQLGAATVGYGPGNPGMLLTDYADQVVGTLGPGPGALAMLGLASQGGQLDLQAAAVANAAPAGSGEVRGVPVTYYDVTIDVRAIAGSPDLSDVQRAAVDAALPLLEQSGYQGTTERIGIGDDGYIHEVIATTRFDDGSTSERHSVLYNFGCAPKVSMPNEPPAPTEAPPCPAPTRTTTMDTTNTTAASSTTPTSPAPTTNTSTAPPAPTSTSASAPTTSTSKPVGSP